jgi:hypothetical protein
MKVLLVIAAMMLVTAPAYASKVEISLDHQTRILLQNAVNEMAQMRQEMEKIRRELELLRRTVERK